jgi:hypothetical protein
MMMMPTVFLAYINKTCNLSGYAKQVMVIYNGIHYDALAVSPSPRSSESEDLTEFNPRTARGKKILAAAQKLVELTHK